MNPIPKLYSLVEISFTIKMLRNERSHLAVRVNRLIGLLKTFNLAIRAIKKEYINLQIDTKLWRLHKSATGIISKRDTCRAELEVANTKIRNIKDCTAELNKLYELASKDLIFM